MSFQVYQTKGGKQLRCGYTTGTCAALAAKAATQLLLTQKPATTAFLTTPNGTKITVPLSHLHKKGKWAHCGIIKDAGDDPDCTDGCLVTASVSLTNSTTIAIDGGQGVGRITLPGLEQPVGSAAINRVPRQMIYEQVRQVCQKVGYNGGVQVIISIPRGEELAKKTFNPNLGILGGLSILGTSGIVEPFSVAALVDTIEVELKMHAEQGHKKILAVPGNIGESFLAEYPFLAEIPVVRFSNYVGELLDFALVYGFQSVLIIGHLGKLVKLAGGIMNTHSSMADCRAELFAAHAALAGANQSVIAQLMGAITTDQCMTILDQAALRQPVLESLLIQIQHHLDRRVQGKIQVGAVVASLQFGQLGATTTATKQLTQWQKQEEKS